MSLKRLDYVLGHVIGQGGMGRVWRAVHQDSGQDVALKVLSPGWAREPMYREAFNREVRAVAGLVHPGIISLYDHGVAGEDGLGQGVSPGSPFLVMEYVEGGSLEQWAGPWRFELLCALILQVTDALAHAHARGVIHRDLKPGNILVGWREAQVVFKLADFGIAHAWVLEEEDGADALVAGTPPYMPPEQILGQAHVLGPWTDLYALGCLIWELCCGFAPFDAATPMRIMGLQLTMPPPQFNPRFEVPSWFVGWLLRLLAKDHAQRFRCAADAAWALRRRLSAPLEPLSVERWHSALSLVSAPPSATQLQHTALAAPKAPRADSAVALSTTLAQHTANITQMLPELHVERASVRAMPDALAVERAPFEPQWRAAHESIGAPLSNVGLALFGLREVPFVGRAVEREQIWAALAEVHRSRRAATVCVSGASGVGKSKLLEWVCLRASELGAAQILHARHIAQGGPRHGLGPMLGAALRVAGTRGAQRFAQLKGWLEGGQDAPPGADATNDEAAAIMELISPQLDQSPSAADGLVRVRFGQDDERYALLWRTLERLYRRDLERPLILWLDDVQWGADALSFVRWVQARQDQDALPVLILMGWREDILAERHVEGALVEALLGQGAGLTHIKLEPLEAAAHQRFLAQLLKLDDALYGALLERTQGNPMFAVQLLSDWIERGWLIPAARGFQLDARALNVLPDDLHTLWRQRIGRLMLKEFPGERATAARCALEIAALLGQEVDLLEWETACMLAQLGPVPMLLEILGEQGLVRAREQGFGFVHGMLRECLERLAFEADRSRAHHAQIAQMLRVLYGEHAVGHASRYAHHLIGAGLMEEALEPLLDASYQAQLDGRYLLAQEHLERHRAQCARLGLGEDDARVLRARQQGVWLRWLQHGPGAQERAENAQIELQATALGLDDVAGECKRWRALVMRFEGDLYGSLAALEGALASFDRAGDEAGAARTRQSMAVVLRMLGRLARAEHELTQAIRLAERCDLFVLLPRCFGNLAQVSLQRGAWEIAAARFDRALQVSLELGDRKAAAFAWAGMGELALCLGEPERAKQALARAIEGFEALGSRYAQATRLDLACVEVFCAASVAPPKAVALLQSALHQRSPTGLDEAARIAAMLVVSAAAGEPRWRQHWDAWAARLAPLLEQLDESRWLLVLLCERASGCAEEQGDAVRAANALDWALKAKALLHRRALATTAEYKR